MNARIVTRRLDLENPWTLSRGTAAFKEYAFLCLEADGHTSWGEAAHNSRYGESLETVIPGLERGIAHLQAHAETGPALDAIRQDGGIPQAARAALEIAALDLAGKREGLPLRALLGLADRVPPVTSFSLGIDTPDVVRRKAEAASGFAVLKLKLGSPDDRALVRAVREVTAVPLRVDANEGWLGREAALTEIEWLAGQGVELVEQPLPAGRLEDVAWLYERSPLPLVADEDMKTAADLPGLVGVYHGVNLKLMKAGGPREGVHIFREAARCGLRVMLGCMIETSCGISAAAHLSGEAEWVDLDGHLLLAADPFTGLTFPDGRVRVSGAPGTGVSLAEED